jgi:hypothetical protein
MNDKLRISVSRGRLVTTKLYPVFVWGAERSYGTPY